MKIQCQAVPYRIKNFRWTSQYRTLGTVRREKAMAAAVVAIFLGGIIVIIEAILSILGIAMFISPYAGGALISVAVCEEIPGAKNLVPGHAVLNYLLVLLIVEVIIVFLVHLPQLNTAMTVLLSSFFLCAMGYVILDQFRPDSIGYCIVLSVVYAIAIALIIKLNLDEWDYSYGEKKLFFRILGGVLYGISAVLISFPLLGGVWFKYYKQGTLYSFIAGMIMIALAVGGGIAGGVNDI